MYNLRKKPYLIVVILLLLIVIFVLYVMTSSEKKVAKEFINLYYNVSDTHIYNSNDINEYEAALFKKYGNIMTNNALKTSASNRSILEGEEAAYKWLCTLKVKKITLKLVDNDNGKSYDYIVNAQVKYIDGNKKDILATGTLKLIKEGNKWKVDSFYTKIGELYKLMSK